MNTEVPVVLPPAFIYIPPLSELMKVIYGETALEDAYESNSQIPARWPSYRSLRKWFMGAIFRVPTRPSSMHSLDIMEADMKAAGFTVPAVVWKPYCEWIHFIKNGLLKDQRSIDMWLGRLESDLQLARSFVGIDEVSERIQAVIHSPLIDDLGAPGSRKRMTANEWVGEADVLLARPVFKQTRVADAYCCFVRFMAWLIVDASLQHWPKVVVAGKENEILLLNLVPRLDPKTAEWTQTLGLQVQELAVHAGHDCRSSPSAFLGGLWSNSTADAQEKARTLRKWETTEPVKPRSSSIDSLLSSIDPQLREHGGLWGEKGVHRRRFQFTWAMIAVFRDMRRLELPDELIDEVFSCYALEYCFARRFLCKPLV